MEKGRSVTITTSDLTAIDPDDSATDLVFAVSNQTNGIVVLSSTPNKSLDSFTQQDIIDFINNAYISTDGTCDGAQQMRRRSVTQRVGRAVRGGGRP